MNSTDNGVFCWDSAGILLVLLFMLMFRLMLMWMLKLRLKVCPFREPVRRECVETGLNMVLGQRVGAVVDVCGEKRQLLKTVPLLE